jgi:dTDP-4-dehydrorhamnose 3,5-epimerase
MIIRELCVRGAFEFTPTKFPDDRGTFLELFKADEFTATIGHPLDLQQANCSVSRRGVVRGIHFSDVPPGQAKYVTCVRGSILDVVVDIRVGSPTFGQHETVRLDDTDRRAVYLSEGLGHGFVSLEDETTVVYLCSTGYAPAREHGINPFDPELAISWPRDVELIVSAKDEQAPSLATAGKLGLLPSLTTVSGGRLQQSPCPVAAGTGSGSSRSRD